MKIVRPIHALSSQTFFVSFYVFKRKMGIVRTYTYVHKHNMEKSGEEEWPLVGHSWHVGHVAGWYMYEILNLDKKKIN